MAAVYQSGMPINTADKDDPVRQSMATSGQPYSDFEEEEDDDAAAVGSGIVETNSDHEDMDNFEDYSGGDNSGDGDQVS